MNILDLLIAVNYKEGFIACIVEAASNPKQKPGMFECTGQILLCHCQLCNQVGGCTLENLL
jgi:hypothetical protein